MSGAQGVQRRMQLRQQQKVSLEKQISETRVQNDQTVLKLVEGLYIITKEVEGLKNAAKKLNGAFSGLLAMAQAATWRSMAIQKLLAPLGISEELIIEKANELLVAEFEAASDKADVESGLIKADDQAKAGDTVVAMMKSFLGGKEVVAFRSYRTRFEIGGTDTFQEITDATIGMKVGETKRFALPIEDKVDECELTLLGIRRPTVKESIDEAPQNPVEQSPEA